MVLLGLLILVMARAVSGFGRYGGRTVGVAAIVLSVVVLVPALHSPAVPIERASSIAPAGLWRPYGAAALRELVAGEQLVFVDVSAAWCLTCKVNELTVLERAPVADKLHEPGVIAMLPTGRVPTR